MGEILNIPLTLLEFPSEPKKDEPEGEAKADGESLGGSEGGLAGPPEAPD
jgi:hypothetical protein